MDEQRAPAKACLLLRFSQRLGASGQESQVEGDFFFTYSAITDLYAYSVLGAEARAVRG